MNVAVTKRAESTQAADVSPSMDGRPALSEARMPDGKPVASRDRKSVV